MTEAIAVGSKEFVSTVKQELGMCGSYRSVDSAHGAYLLCDRAHNAYNAVLTCDRAHNAYNAVLTP